MDLIKGWCTSRSAQLSVMPAGAMAGAKSQGPTLLPTGSHGREVQYSPVGLLGRGVEGLLLLGPAEARVAAAVAFGTVWVLLEPGLPARAEASLDGETGLDVEARFSGIFASATGC